MKCKYTEQKVFCLDREMKLNINAVAEEASTTASEVIRECVRMYIPRIRARITNERKKRDKECEREMENA